MSLGNSDKVREGETYAFTGYPTGMVLGLNAVTHRGIISAITPIVIPQLSGQFLEKRILSRLVAPYDVFQLDATAIRVTAVARFTTPKQVRSSALSIKCLFRRAKKPSFRNRVESHTPFRSSIW